MGQVGEKVCGINQITIEDPLALNFGKDQRQAGIKHFDDLSFNNAQGKQNKQLMKIINQWTKQLNSYETFYKDPNLSSDPVILKSKLTQKQFRCTYQRPYKFLDHGVKAQPYKIIDFRDSQPSAIEVRDQIMQYFGVFLCFLADKPTLIQKIIISGQNSYGLHAIAAYREGRSISFVIDDYILCRDKSLGKLQPVFSQPQKNMYMWPCLLEKAWFKLKGNFVRKFQQNCPQQVFQSFLSFPIQKFYFNEGINSSGRQTLNKVFSNDYNIANRGYICKSKKSPEHDIGLSGSKYFYVLDTFIDDGKRMFYLRNPTGNIQFRGMYDKIPQKLLDILEKKYMQISPGNFLIDQEQFIEQMSQILVIHYLPGSKITSYPIQFENQQETFIGFDLKNKGVFNLSVIQNYHQSSKLKAYYPLIYHVVQLNDMRLIGGSQNKQGCFGVKNTYLLDRFNQDSASSRYLIRLKKKQYYQIQNIKLYLVGYYMENIKFQIPTQFQLAQKWQQFLKKEGARQLAITDQSRQKTSQIAHSVCWLGDIAYIYVQKRSKRQQVSIEVCFPELMNLQCISHPQIKRSNQWKSFKVSDKFLIIFQKINLTAQTHIRQYHIESY